MDCYILWTVSLVIILLFIMATIFIIMQNIDLNKKKTNFCTSNKKMENDEWSIEWKMMKLVL